MSSDGVNLRNVQEMSRSSTTDTVVHSVVDKYVGRSSLGIKKYGVTLDRDDLTEEEWLTHLQEELMDATLYVEKLIRVIRKRVSQTPVQERADDQEGES